MLRLILSTMTAAMLAGTGTMGIAFAHGHHHHFGWAQNATIVGNDENGDEDNDAVSVAEPVVTTTQYVAVPQTQVVAVNDAVVTPYGYTPVYTNGYYQGYSYSPQYAYNPYYAATVYSGYTGANPLATAVVSTVATALANRGHINTSDVLTTLLAGFVASQVQPQYQQQPYAYGAYPAGYVQQPVYVQQQTPVQAVVQQLLVPQTVAVPVQPAPVYYIPQ